MKIISIPSFYQAATEAIEQSQSFAERHKKVIGIALLALSCLAACYFLISLCFRAKPLPEVITDQEETPASGKIKNSPLLQKVKEENKSQEIWSKN